MKSHSIIRSVILWLTVLYLILLATSGKSQPLPDTLELDRLLELAAEKSLARKQAIRDFERVQLDYRLYQSNLRPNINATANFPNYLRTFSEIVQPNGSISFQNISNNNSSLGLTITQNIPQTGGFLFVQSNLQRFDDFNNDLSSYNGVPFRIGLFQPLFAFNPLKWEKKIQPLQLQEARLQQLADQEQIRQQATRLFMDLLNIHNELQITLTNKANNQTLFEIARERHALGKISESDLIRLELELISAEKDIQEIRQAVREASSRIYSLLGLQNKGKLLFPRFPEVKDSIPVDVETALEEASRHRADIFAFQRRMLEAERGIAQARGEGGFQASLNASFGLARSSMQVEDIYSDPQQEQVLQLQLNIPILDWGAQKARVQRANIDAEFEAAAIEQNKLEFDNEIRDAVAAFNGLQKEIFLAERVDRLAQKRYAIASESYVLGSISITELTIARQEKDQASRAYLRTLVRYWNSYFTLRQLTLYDFAKDQTIR
jgi:outer membrane protein